MENLLRKKGVGYITHIKKYKGITKQLDNASHVQT